MPIRPLDWLHRDTGKKSKFRRSKVAENRVAGALGGRRAVMSGAARISAHSTETEGADIKVRHSGPANVVGAVDGLRLHLEHKRTGTPQMRVQREWFLKVNASSHRTASHPAVALLFETLTGSARDWLGLPTSAFRTCVPVEMADRLLPERLSVNGDSLTLKAAWLDKLITDSCDDRRPAFIVTFVGARTMPAEWVFVPLETFKALRGEES